MRVKFWMLGLLVALAGGAAWVFLAFPDRTQVQTFEDLPWQVEVVGPDRTRVLGIVLGESTLAELAGTGRRLLGPEIRLFQEPDGTRSVEAFYSNARIPPFEANLVLLLDLDEQGLERIWNERTSERPTPSGARRYGLSDTALRELGHVPVIELSYGPRARWDPDLLRARFGEPSAQIRLDDDQDYWLYPERGLAIMVPTGRGRTLMHYVTLSRWETLLQKLELAGERRLGDAADETP